MKSIKLVLPLFVFQVVLGVAVQAMTLHSRGEGSSQEASQMSNVDERLRVLSNRLNLSREQQASVKPILDDQYVQSQAVKQDGSLSQDDKTNKLREVQEASSSKIRTLLDDSQKQKYAELEQEMGQRVGRGQGEGRGPDGIREGRGQGQGQGRPTVAEHLKFLTDKLSLSPDQQPKIQAILEDQRAQMQTIWQDNSLSREDKTGKAQIVREATNTKIRAVLTDDQRKKFDSML